jgi:fibrillarin-like rRNA methylase
MLGKMNENPILDDLNGKDRSFVMIHEIIDEIYYKIARNTKVELLMVNNLKGIRAC